jgi:AraC family transcriptional regulator
MTLVNTTIWFIESHLDDDLTLAGLAAEGGVAQAHLARVFSRVTGLPVMRYVWRRRLARAVRLLATTNQSVLNVALGAGYASHEAFTRAFRAEFGLSPAMMQALGDPAHLSVLAAKEFYMDADFPLAPPRIEICGPRRFVGLNAHYSRKTKAGIPQQWERFNADDPDIENSYGQAAFGVIHAFTDDGEWDYACAYEVSKIGAVPEGYKALSFPASTYAVFATDGHVTAINSVIDKAMTWIDQSAYQFADGPTLERYGPAFDPVSGNGGFEVWAAVLPRT